MDLAAALSAGSSPVLQIPTSNDLKAVMRHVAGTVSVITAGSESDRTGATVTSATALSVEPPTMIVNINRSSSTWPVVARYRHFCINILEAAQQTIAERFSGKDGIKGKERYEGAGWTVLATGAPVLIGALAAVDCEVEDVIERHSHAIVLGRVAGLSFNGGSPLIYSHGKYHAVTS